MQIHTNRGIRGDSRCEYVSLGSDTAVHRDNCVNFMCICVASNNIALIFMSMVEKKR